MAIAFPKCVILIKCFISFANHVGGGGGGEGDGGLSDGSVEHDT